VVYEAFRAPKFIPHHLRKKYEEGQFEIAMPREKFEGSDEEYRQLLPGHLMDNWVTELQTSQMLRFIDELNTPGAKLPQYLNTQHCENVWRMMVKPDSLYRIWTEDYVSKYYDRVSDFFYWNKVPVKQEVDYIFKRDLWKLKPQHEHRMIRAGYGPEPETKSLGKYVDIERAFHGFPGPLTTHYNHRFQGYESARGD